jgi:hypothetical protein
VKRAIREIRLIVRHAEAARIVKPRMYDLDGGVTPLISGGWFDE